MKAGKFLSILTAAVLMTGSCSGMLSASALNEGSYQYQINQDGKGVTITKYYGNETAPAVPARIGGRPVTCIGEYAFSGMKNMTGITLPDTLKEIGAWALD